ncbi:hypothetical protein BS47DRAFT_1339906 [Hydnum rufescens UP504]|uniref:Uncharacterized protein n=1 Tax=Hydnum rufescens UP504 TaxID=1448309 RepID=A0A9P6DX86_9AGAM|nr:hypothetical protein BS47DRAFT_1339906 [Hydnum rufescens UP504]
MPSSVADHHAEEHDAKHAAKHTENPALQPHPWPIYRGQKEDGEAEAETLQGVQDDLELPGTLEGESTVDAARTDETVDSIKEALDSSLSAVTRASEKEKSSDSDDFVKIEKEDANPTQQTHYTLTPVPTGYRRHYIEENDQEGGLFGEEIENLESHSLTDKHNGLSRPPGYMHVHVFVQNY